MKLPLPSPPTQSSPVPVCPFFPLMACLVCLCKALRLTQGHPLMEKITIGSGAIYNDFSFLSFFFLALYLQSGNVHKAVRALLGVAQAVLLFWYFTDTLVIAALNQRVNLIDFFSYADEAQRIDEIRSIAMFFFFYAILSIYAQRFKINLFRGRIACYALFLMFFSSLGFDFSGYIPDNLAATNARLRRNVLGTLASKLSAEEMLRLGAESSLFESNVARYPYRNVILVLIESFSACDSKATSGIFDRFPHFDKMAKQGALFRNFLANSSFTEGGLVSILTGNPPLIFPGYPYSLEKASRDQDSVPRAFKKAGFTTSFLSSASLSFRSKSDFLSTLGFDVFRGVDEVPRFKGQQKYNLNSVPDRLLYEEALETIGALTAKAERFFLVVETTSSHLPYIDPLGRGNSEANVLDYVDQQLEWFSAELKRKNFYDSGLLIITGDHRKMMPVSKEEKRRFRGSEEFRVPLLLLGKGIRAGQVDDRLLQQADLFRYLPELPSPAKPLTEFSYFTGIYAAPLLGANPWTAKVTTASGGSYSFSMIGKRFSWVAGSHPPEDQDIQYDVLQRLARLQYCYDHAPFCSTGKKKRWFFGGKAY